MGKKLAKELDGNFRYIKGSYYSEYNDFDVTIRYDYTSMLYNIYFNVKGKEDMKELNDLLEHIDKHAVAKYFTKLRQIKRYAKTSKYYFKRSYNIFKET